MSSQLIFKGSSFKKLTFGSASISGRNNSGKITLYHRGGACKKKIRLLDFKKYIWNMFGFVHRIEYDPKRNSLIALITYSNGIMTYTISNEGLRVGDFIINGENLQLKAGNTTPLNFIPVGLKINSLEIYPNAGAQFIRAAGSFATIISKFNKLGIIKLKSGEIRKVLLDCIATIGTVSNFQYMYRNFRKAGYFRLKGWRPTVRGVAMNPIDHPHGGGQGKTSGGRPSVTPWGVITKGKPTRKKISPMVVKLRKN